MYTSYRGIVYRHVFSSHRKRNVVCVQACILFITVCAVPLEVVWDWHFSYEKRTTHTKYHKRRQICAAFILNKETHFLLEFIDKVESYWSAEPFVFLFYCCCWRCYCPKRKTHSWIHGQFLLQCNPLNIANVLLIGFANAETSRILILNHNFIAYLFGSIFVVGWIWCFRFLFLFLFLFCFILLFWNVNDCGRNKQELLLWRNSNRKSLALNSIHILFILVQ